MAERHIILSDLHIPDQDQGILPLIFRLLSDLKPDYIHLLGDTFHFSEVSKYLVDADYQVTLSDEIEEGREFLAKIRRYTDNLLFYPGNHEARLQKYLNLNAKAVARLRLDGEKVVSLPHLLKFKELKIRLLDRFQVKNFLLYHGDIIRGKSGYTASAYLDKNGISTITGHTHRQALITRSLYDRKLYGIENGCLCNYQPTPYYGSLVKDWVQGFTVLEVVDGVVYPQVVPIINSSFTYQGHVYGQRSIHKGTRRNL